MNKYFKTNSVTYAPIDEHGNILIVAMPVIAEEEFQNLLLKKEP